MELGFDDVDVESGDTSHTTTPPGPRSTVRGAAPTADRPDGEIEHRDYDEAHQKLSNTVLAVFDVATELANKATDIAFTFTVLQSEAPDLFYASIAVLTMPMLIRLAIALRPWFVPQTGFTGAPPIDPTKRWTYWWGVLVSLVEPLSGTEIIHGARKSFDTMQEMAAQMDLEGWNRGGSHRFGELGRVQYNATLAEAVARLRVTTVMLAIEDVPELAIDLVFLFRVGGGVSGDTTLFTLTLALTLLHMLRTGVELVFQLVFLKHIPRVLKIPDSATDGELDRLLSGCKCNPNQYASADVRHQSEKAAQIVARLVARSKFLSTIEARGGVPIAAIAEALKVNKTVKYIGLSNNQLGPEGGVAIAEALKVNETLKNIGLSNNHLGPEGGKAIAEALKVNTTIKTVHLDVNELGPAGGKAIAEALKVNKTLDNITLADNKLGPEGGKAIAEALKVNKTITKTIHLSGNDLDEAAAIALAAFGSRVTTHLSPVSTFGIQ